MIGSIESHAVVPAAGEAVGPGAGTLVQPFARALWVLGAYTPGDRWLGNRDLSVRTGLPPSTVVRIAQCLVGMGYLRRHEQTGKFRLASAVLALGYGAVANTDLLRVARAHMQQFAARQGVDVCLWSRERLELTVVVSSGRPGHALPAAMLPGARAPVACSPAGWALLAVLPERERYYLMDQIERRGDLAWPRQRRRIAEAIAQVNESGVCICAPESDTGVSLACVPIMLEGHAPLVLACTAGHSLAAPPGWRRSLAASLRALAETILQAARAS